MPNTSASKGRSSHRLKSLLQAEAQRLGLDLLGVTRWQTPPHASKFLDWLNKGHHGEMAYMARAPERRTHPQSWIPWARSVVVVGLAYGSRDRFETDGFLFARYARLKDYHKTLQKRLRRLLRVLHSEIPDLQAKIYVDTGPVLEREFAMMAGLGWIGKNTNLIAWKQGSYFVLGLLIVSVELDPDPPLTTDHCGTCQRCIEACPTHALVAPWVLDSTRCISYWTIEARGIIPWDLREKMGQWVFGCDLCQEVCPWNQKVRDVEAEVTLPDPEAILRSDEEAFRRLFQGTAIKRAKREGLVRNLLVAIGNRRDARWGPQVHRLLTEDPNPVVRAHAAWTLAKIRGVKARPVLEHALHKEPDPRVREEIRRVLKDLLG